MGAGRGFVESWTGLGGGGMVAPRLGRYPQDALELQGPPQARDAKPSDPSRDVAGLAAEFSPGVVHTPSTIRHRNGKQLRAAVREAHG